MKLAATGADIGGRAEGQAAPTSTSTKYAPPQPPSASSNGPASMDSLPPPPPQQEQLQLQGVTREQLCRVVQHIMEQDGGKGASVLRVLSSSPFHLLLISPSPPLSYHEYTPPIRIDASAHVYRHPSCSAYLPFVPLPPHIHTLSHTQLWSTKLSTWSVPLQLSPRSQNSYHNPKNPSAPVNSISPNVPPGILPCSSPMKGLLTTDWPRMEKTR